MLGLIFGCPEILKFVAGQRRRYVSGVAVPGLLPDSCHSLSHSR